MSNVYSEELLNSIRRKNEIISDCQSAIDEALKSYSSEDMPKSLKDKLEKASAACLLELGI